MKKVLVFVLCTIVLVSGLSFSVSAKEKNLCDVFLEVRDFHYFYNMDPHSDPDIGGYVGRDVQPGELYSLETIMESADMIYYANPDKYTVIKKEFPPMYLPTLDEMQKPFSEYVWIPEKEYIEFVKAHFNTTEEMLEELRNYKVRNYSYRYDENGTPIYNEEKAEYMVAIADGGRQPKHYYWQLIGYVKNGNNFDVYLNIPEGELSKTPPEGKIEYVDYCPELYYKYPQGYVTYYSSISDDWTKYTVSYDGNTIKYLSNVKVSSAPSDLINPNTVIPDVVTPPASSSFPSESSKSQQIVANTSSVSSATSSETASVESIVEDITTGTDTEIKSEPEEKTDETKPEKKNSKKAQTTFIITISSVAFLAIGALAWYFIFFKRKK